ncbi:putative toxin-antitoxin system toxin component, PIN family [Parapedobacter tibetensis]|uniref:putative toxin-antitoxin system toxin component, PIN family n=1 Tax=Parapedobacter tibetensis TaxID=2972951 RepID=UPI00214DA903|nr:putative toxin-antitoxin system toxin component, PIN family [Parapedobacter tibetensis]
MQKIVIDTNVIVSALIQRGYPFLIVDAIFDNINIQVCISEELFQEYYDVLNRKKFAKFPDFLMRAQTLLADIELRAVKFTPTAEVMIIKDDDDNMLLELAEVSDAAYLITGNSNDFTITAYKNTKIVSPKEFWEIYTLS